VIFVTGRSSVEGYLLSIFGGLTHLAVGENGGCITFGDKIQHKLLGNKGECIHALATIQSKLDAEIKEKPVFPRMTEVVLERTFDIKQAQKIIDEDSLNVSLTDSGYAYHINSKGVDKGSGFLEAIKILEVDVNDTIAIGDSETDSTAAKAAKIPFILIENGYTEKKPDQIYYNHLIKNFVGLEEIIQKYIND